MLEIGTKPTSESSSVSGLTQRIYDNLVTEGFFQSEDPIETTVGDNTYTEEESARADRVFKSKTYSWVIAKSIIDEFTSNGEVDGVADIIKASLATTVTVPNDGGTSLKTTLDTSLGANNQTGTIS